MTLGKEFRKDLTLKGLPLNKDLNEMRQLARCSFGEIHSRKKEQQVHMSCCFCEEDSRRHRKVKQPTVRPARSGLRGGAGP